MPYDLLLIGDTIQQPPVGRCLAVLAAGSDVTEVLAAGALPFVGTVDVVGEGRFVDPLAKVVTLCLDEVADPWVSALLVSSAALAVDM